MDIKEIIDNFYDAYNRHDPEAAAELYLPDGRHLEIAQGQVSEGRDSIRVGLARFFEAFPDIHWQERRRIMEGNQAAITYLMTGTLHSQLGPFSPQGQKLELRGVHVIQLSGSSIKSSEDYWDAATFGRQMAQSAS